MVSVLNFKNKKWGGFYPTPQSLTGRLLRLSDVKIQEPKFSNFWALRPELARGYSMI